MRRSMIVISSIFLVFLISFISGQYSVNDIAEENPDGLSLFKLKFTVIIRGL